MCLAVLASDFTMIRSVREFALELVWA